MCNMVGLISSLASFNAPLSDSFKRFETGIIAGTDGCDGRFAQEAGVARRKSGFVKSNDVAAMEPFGGGIVELVVCSFASTPSAYALDKMGHH
eukprot:CCRYP_003182-RA/>CCRYP_003182-RA protein AED:0.42 eAED:0.54 QI:666/0/0.33/1/0/0/3/0/92